MRYLLIVILILTLPCLALSQGLNSAQETKVIRGTVAHIDWVAGKLVVRTADFGEIDEITFIVSDDTQITKGTSTISFSAVNQSGAVAVEYYSNSLAGLKATNVTLY